MSKKNAHTCQDCCSYEPPHCLPRGWHMRGIMFVGGHCHDGEMPRNGADEVGDCPGFDAAELAAREKVAR